MAQKKKKFDFENPYQYYLIRGQESELPASLSIDKIKEYSQKKLSPLIDEINKANAGKTFEGKIKDIKDSCIEKENSILKSILGKDFNIYENFKNNEEKILFLTKLYFTNSISKDGDLNSMDMETISNDGQKSFLFLASTSKFSSGLESSSITLSSGEIKNVANQLLNTNYEKTDIINILKKLCDKDANMIQFKRNGEIDDQFLINLKADLENNLTWGTIKKHIKDRADELRQDNELLEMYIIDPTSSKKDEFPILEVGFLPSVRKFKKVLLDRCDDIKNQAKQSKKKIKLSFTTFQIYVESSTLQTMAINAKKFINSADFTKKICYKKNGVYQLNVNSSSAGGALGEITARLGGESFFTNLKLTGTETFYGQSSFADVQGEGEVEGEKIKVGLNIKHYSKNDFSLYKQNTYQILSNQVALYQYMKKEYLIGMRFLEINYNFLSKLEELRGEKILNPQLTSKKGREQAYIYLAQSSLPGFIRQASEFEKEVVTPFYIINNLVIPASIVFEKILESIKNVDYFSASSNPLPLQYKSKDIENNPTINLMADDFSLSGENAGTITFNGLSVSIDSLTKNGNLRISFNKSNK